MMKQFKTKDQYESVYLLEARLKKSFTKESQSFLKENDVKRAIRYSCALSAKKNYSAMTNAGVDMDDLIAVSNCYAMVFYTHYRTSFKNKKHLISGLMRFLGQRLYKYMEIGGRKFKTGIVYYDDPTQYTTAIAKHSEEVGKSSGLINKIAGVDKKQKNKLLYVARNSKDPSLRGLAQDVCELLGFNYID